MICHLNFIPSICSKKKGWWINSGTPNHIFAWIIKIFVQICRFLTELTTGRQVTWILFFLVRYFTHLNFWLPVMYILIVGLFFHEEAKQTTLLHRQQTDEWKGNVVKDDIFYDDIFNDEIFNVDTYLVRIALTYYQGIVGLVHPEFNLFYWIANLYFNSSKGLQIDIEHWD